MKHHHHKQKSLQQLLVYYKSTPDNYCKSRMIGSRLRQQLAFVWLLPMMFGGTTLGLTMMATPSIKTSSPSALATSRDTATAAVIPTSPNSRRNFLVETSSATAAAAILSGIASSEPARAAYGTSSNMELPNYIEFLLEKNAVPDEGAFLYQGPDPKVQLQRLLDATKRLDSIAPLAADKKWSQIQGLLTGPLGTLGQTLTAIASSASSKSSTAELTAKSKKVKEDIFNINLAASKKNPEAVVANAKAAQASLEAFVRAAF